MIIEVKVPSPGESITEVEIAEWLVTDGAIVEKDQELAEIESEKATLSLVAEKGGKVSIKKEAHESIPVGDVACTIDTSFEPENSDEPEEITDVPEETQKKEDEISEKTRERRCKA